MKVKTDKSNNKRIIFRAILIVLFVALLGYCSYCIASNAADSARLKAQLEDQQTTLQEVDDENEEIKSILDSDDKSDYMEQQAREKGYVKEDETVYYDIGSSK